MALEFVFLQLFRPRVSYELLFDCPFRDAEQGNRISRDLEKARHSVPDQPRQPVALLPVLAQTLGTASVLCAAGQTDDLRPGNRQINDSRFELRASDLPAHSD